MAQSPLGTRMAWESRRRVQSWIFLNQGIDFEYTQLLPGVEMIQLKLWSQGPTLVYIGWATTEKIDHEAES